MRYVRNLCVALVVLVMASAVAHARSGEEVVARAGFFVDDLLRTLPPDEAMRRYVQNAYGVIVVPDLLEGGFVIGAEHGNGVLLVRDPITGQFGPPTFVQIFGGSLGLQVGGKTSEVVMTIMNEDAVDRIIQGDVKFGADVGVALARIGASLGAATTTGFGEDVYVFERSEGIFGGASIGAGGMYPNRSLMDAYWGQGATPRQVARDFGTTDQRSADLRQKLVQF
ncbi:MAG: lipid-binding SYLF domain-containing protein [Pseudomonadota bacterium]